MTAQPGWPAVSGAATFQDIRRAFAGMVVKSTAGVLRAGVLPVNPSAPLITAGSGWVFNVAAVVFVLDRNGAVFLPNVGVAPVTISSAPTSGSRWSVLYAKQRETDAPFSDSVNGPIIDKVESTTSLASARSVVPPGATEIGYVKVDAGATSATDSTKVFVTETCPFTAFEGGTVLLRNQAEMDAWAPHDGSKAYLLGMGDYARVSGNWVPAVATATYSIAITAFGDNTLASTTIPTTPIVAETNDSSFITARTGTACTVKRGFYIVTMEFALLSGATFTGRSFAEILVGGSSIGRVNSPSGEGESLVACTIPVFVPTDSTVITGQIFKISGGNANVSGRLTLMKVA